MTPPNKSRPLSKSRRKASKVLTRLYYKAWDATHDEWVWVNRRTFEVRRRPPRGYT